MATILIVDDERLIRISLAMLLQTFDHDVETAATAAEALEIATRRPPDLLLVDWMLAGAMDGLQLTKRMRVANDALPAIVVTGCASPEIEAQIESLPATWLICKPCSMNELVAAIEIALRAPTHPQ